MKISKRYYLDLCDYAHITILKNEQKAIGASTDDTGRMINVKKYLTILGNESVPLTGNQLKIIEFLAELEKIRRKNGGNG